MKNIRLTIDSPSIPPDSIISHTGTSWQVSKSLDFTNVGNLLLNVQNDQVNLNEYRTALPIGDNDVVYIRSKYHFDDKESDWSRIISSKGNQEGLHFSNTIVATPVISVDKSVLSTGEVIVNLSTSEFKMLAGVGAHASTSWTICDTDGNVIYERKNDEDNLTEFKFNTKGLDKTRLYELKVRHHSSTYSDSYCGRTLFTLQANENRLYEITQVGDLVTKRDLYFKLISYTAMFESVDLMIQDTNGTVVAERLNQQTLTPYLSPGVLIPYERYNILARIKIGEDVYTPYRLIYSGIAYENYLVTPDPYITYLSKYDFTQMMIMGGITVQNTHEFYQGTILLTKNNDRSIYRYKIKNGILSEIGKCIVLPTDSVLGIPYINILPLYNGDVVVNYYDDASTTSTPHSVFRKYKHNVVSNKFTELNSTDRLNELLSTALTASACVLRDNSIWYIPARETDENDVETKLSLYRLDTETFNVEKVADLPFNAVRNVSLCATRDDKLIILNGSYIDGYVEDESEVMKWVRTNHTIWKFDPVVREFSAIGNMSAVNPDFSVLQMYLRRDGKMVMFNAADDGVTIGDQQSYELDPVTGVVTLEGNDTPDNLVYQSTVVLRNGDFLRFTNNQEDPQVVHRYVSNTMAESELDENTYITDTITDLVVGLNREVTIYDPYKYKSITILGTSDLDTGTLIWNDRGVIRTFNYEDLIVYSNMEVPKDAFDAKRYRSILVLDERSLSITFESVVTPI